MGDEEAVDVEGLEEEGDAGAGGEQGGFKLPGLSPLLVRILMVTLVAIGVITVTIITLVIMMNTVFSTGSSTPQVTGLEIGPIEAPSYFDLGEFNQVTADTDNQHFVRVNIMLTYRQNDQRTQIALNERRPIFRDMVGQMLAQRRYAWLQNSDNWDLLKQDIQNQVNSRIDGEVTGVVFDNFLVN